MAHNFKDRSETAYTTQRHTGTFSHYNTIFHLNSNYIPKFYINRASYRNHFIVIQMQPSSVDKSAQ